MKPIKLKDCQVGDIIIREGNNNNSIILLMAQDDRNCWRFIVLDSDPYVLDYSSPFPENTIAQSLSIEEKLSTKSMQGLWWSSGLERESYRLYWLGNNKEVREFVLACLL